MPVKKKANSAGAASSRIAISLSPEELQHVNVVAIRFGMKPAAFAAFCVRFYLSNFGNEQSLKPISPNPQPRLDV